MRLFTATLVALVVFSGYALSTVTVNPTTLDFTGMTVSPSAPQSYLLTNDKNSAVAITASAHTEISFSSSSGFTTSLTFPAQGGGGGSVTVYVRVVVATPMSLNENVTNVAANTANVNIMGDIPLPITLAFFTSSILEAGAIRLDWNTLSEVNNYGFYVERRGEEESSFSELANGFVAGHGTTLAPQSYSYVDNTAGPGAWYYRLRQVDLDGTVNYTDPVQASKLTGVAENAPREFALMQNYPNPFNPSTEVKFSVATTGHATLDVYNMLGQKVATLFNGVAEAGKYYGVKFDAAQLASGTYMYRLQSADKSDLKKMMLVR
jgi:hypothetical protein